MSLKIKYKTSLIVMTTALLMGMVSFFVTLKVYDNKYEKEIDNKVTKNIEKTNNDESDTIIAKNENTKIKNEIISKGGETTTKEYLKEEIDVPEIKEDEYNEIINLLSQKDVEENIVETTATIQKEIVEELEFILPISGEIGMEYSTEKLIYSKTLEEWITHNGIDILGEEAAPIKAVESGTVESIKMDPRYGNTIIIKHNDEYKSIYSNVSTTDLVYVGKKIEKGEIISGVGKGFGFECMEEPHIHLTILKNGESINPFEIIK